MYDVHPTLLELTGLKIPKTVQYRSLVPLLKDAEAAHREQLYFAFMQWQRAVRDERFKLIEYCVDGERRTQLFDLQEDSYETQNLAKLPEYHTALEHLRTLLENERLKLNDGNVPYEFSNAQGRSFWATYDEAAN